LNKVYKKTASTSERGFGRGEKWKEENGKNTGWAVIEVLHKKRPESEKAKELKKRTKRIR